MPVYIEPDSIYVMDKIIYGLKQKAPRQTTSSIAINTGTGIKKLKLPVLKHSKVKRIPKQNLAK